MNPQTYVYNFGIQRELPFNLIGRCGLCRLSRNASLFINEQLNPGIGSFDTLTRHLANRGSVIGTHEWRRLELQLFAGAS